MLETLSNRLNGLNIGLLVELSQVKKHKKTCYYCEESLSPGNRAKNQVIPKAIIKRQSHQGEWSAICSITTLHVCQGCHRHKGHKTLDRFREYLMDSTIPKRYTIIRNILRLKRRD